MDDAAQPALSGGPDYGALFRTLPTPYMILDRELRYVDANDAYCETTEQRRETLIGRHVFEIFPNQGPSGRRLQESFEQVLATGRPHSLPLLSYPIPLPRTRGGGFELRYWAAAHTPILDDAGQTVYIVQNTVDVTELQRLRQMAYGADAAEPQRSESVILERAREVEAMNVTLLKETQGLRDLFMQAPGFVAVLAGPDLRFVVVNNAYQQLIGHRPVIGRPLVQALPEVPEQGFAALLEQVMREGEPFVGRSASVHLQRAMDGPLEERFLDFVYQPIVADGRVWGVFVAGSDVTERVMGEQRQKLLVDELNHRVKNTLATVQAIADQTLRTTEPGRFKTAFEARIMALSATHDLLTATSWRSAALSDVLQVELRPFGRDRYELKGPHVDLAPSEALTLGLLFHELATNAAKYGALSSLSGQIGVSWTLTAEGEASRLTLAWRERGGPPVSPPTRRGFGSRLITRSLGASGEADLDFVPDGLACKLSLKLRPQ